MNNDEILKLCLDLVQSENEEEVIRLLKKVGYWNDSSTWQYYGNNENNFSQIGNQQSSADAALVEKIINSVDAVLMRECLKRQIKPESKIAPQSLEKALVDFFGIFQGKLTNIDAKQRTELSRNIALVATGEKSNPSYSIIDKGEGQTPNKFIDTLLSLNRSNKLRIPFVQGKFNMGATGSLQFCGKNNIQLILSKRNPEISKYEGDDSSRNLWGFTIIRRADPELGMRSSTFKYLAPEGNILRFQSDSLPIAPKQYPEPYGAPFQAGTYIKLYEYQLKGLRAPVKFDLYYRLSLLLPNIALPMILYERRKGYTAQSYYIVMSGLSVRLDEDKKDNLEDGFPSSSEIQINGEAMKVLIYAFKKDQIEKYSPKERVIFTVNGQAHGTFSKTFLERKNVGMGYLKDSILVLVDCSNLKGRTKEDLFMNSRDRLREGDLKYEIEKELQDIIKNHEGLRALRERRRREEIETALQDSKPLADVLNKIINKSPTLTKLFIQGIRIKNPFNLINTGTQKKFIGKRYPTFFKLSKKYDDKQPKTCHSNKKFRVQFETDVENDYFIRDIDPGIFQIMHDSNHIESYSLNLWNGLATLTVSLPENAKIGDLFDYKVNIEDRTQDPFINELKVKVIEPDNKHPGNKGGRKKPRGNDDDDERKDLSGFNVPNMIECRKFDKQYKFAEDEEGALKVVDSGSTGYDFFINMDNVFLRTEIKGLTNIEPKLLEARFKYSMVLLGLSLLDLNQKNNKNSKNLENKNDEEGSIYEKISLFAKAASSVVLPMISNLGELEIEE